MDRLESVSRGHLLNRAPSIETSSQSEAAPAAEAALHPVSASYRIYVLFLLFLAYCLSFCDRLILAVISPQLKVEFSLSDSDLGILKGVAFAMFYGIMAVPLAVLSDRWHRVRLIGISLALWSAMTALSGAAQSFLHLATARFMIGIGEAGGNPPSHSLISDYFRKEERGFAFGIYQLGVPVGTLLAFLVGGWLVSSVGWRMTFVAFGLPGFVLAILIWATVREPERGAADNLVETRQSKMGWIAQVKILLNVRILRTMMISGGLNSLAAHALTMWLIDFFVRIHNYSAHSASIMLAFAVGLGGAAGTLTGGYVSDRLSRLGAIRPFDTPAWALIMGGPVIFMACFAPPAVATGLIFVTFFLLYATFGPMYGLVQTLAPVRSRALAMAIYSLSLSLIGAGCGPLLMGIISDALRHSYGEAEALRMALSIASILPLIAGLLLLRRRTEV